MHNFWWITVSRMLSRQQIRGSVGETRLQILGRERVTRENCTSLIVIFARGWGPQSLFFLLRQSRTDKQEYNTNYEIRNKAKVKLEAIRF